MEKLWPGPPSSSPGNGSRRTAAWVPCTLRRARRGGAQIEDAVAAARRSSSAAGARKARPTTRAVHRADHHRERARRRADVDRGGLRPGRFPCAGSRTSPRPTPGQRLAVRPGPSIWTASMAAAHRAVMAGGGYTWVNALQIAQTSCRSAARSIRLRQGARPGAFYQYNRAEVGRLRRRLSNRAGKQTT